jgi:hypothetical protein
MRSIDAIGRARLDPSGFHTTTTLRRRDPDGDERHEGDERRERPKEQDCVTLGHRHADEEPPLPQLNGPGAAPALAPHWERARRF